MFYKYIHNKVRSDHYTSRYKFQTGKIRKNPEKLISKRNPEKLNFKTKSGKIKFKTGKIRKK